MWTMECICQKVRVVFVSRIESIPFKVLGKSKKLQNEASSNSITFNMLIEFGQCHINRNILTSMKVSNI